MRQLVGHIRIIPAARRLVSDYNYRMEFFSADPDIERMPPATTRILDLHASPEKGGRRLRVTLDLTPFQQRPYLELTLADLVGNEVSSASIIEPVVCRLELVMHIRKPDATAGTYNLSASLFYPELGEMDQRKISVAIPNIPE